MVTMNNAVVTMNNVMVTMNNAHAVSMKLVIRVGIKYMFQRDFDFVQSCDTNVICSIFTYQLSEGYELKFLKNPFQFASFII